MIFLLLSRIGDYAPAALLTLLLISAHLCSLGAHLSSLSVH
jgi:hypothetical protein